VVRLCQPQVFSNIRCKILNHFENSSPVHVHIEVVVVIVVIVVVIIVVIVVVIVVDVDVGVDEHDAVDEQHEETESNKKKTCKVRIPFLKFRKKTTSDTKFCKITSNKSCIVCETPQIFCLIYGYCSI
jgi:hypothetical protein